MYITLESYEGGFRHRDWVIHAIEGRFGHLIKYIVEEEQEHWMNEPGYVTPSNKILEDLREDATSQEIINI
jgi:hypothetical protein